MTRRTNRIVRAIAGMAAVVAVAVAGPTGLADASDTPASQVHAYTITDGHGLTMRFLNLGAVITALTVPDRAGRPADVVLGYGRQDDYPAMNAKNRFGAVVGRYAGRIAGAGFTIGGHAYRLIPNDGPNALHGGGRPGTDAQIWRVALPTRDHAILTLVSPDGAQGFPGRLTITVSYRVTGGAVRIDYAARTTRATVLNLTNHSYFNLAGAGSGSVTGQRLRIAAGRWIETDHAGIPTGRLLPVAGTPLDFRDEHAIGERIDTPAPMMAAHGGYNHGWLLDGRGLRAVVRLSDPVSGRTLTVSTTEPSVQAYTGDYFDGHDVGPSGKPVQPRDGIALETQHIADSPHQPAFPTTLLRPGRVFRSTTVWQFGTTR
ncbi:MAG: aldose epimerase family protein [Janthinobacterium lividum]